MKNTVFLYGILNVTWYSNVLDYIKEIAKNYKDTVAHLTVPSNARRRVGVVYHPTGALIDSLRTCITSIQI